MISVRPNDELLIKVDPLSESPPSTTFQMKNKTNGDTVYFKIRTNFPVKNCRINPTIGVLQQGQLLDVEAAFTMTRKLMGMLSLL